MFVESCKRELCDQVRSEGNEKSDDGEESENSEKSD